MIQTENTAIVLRRVNYRDNDRMVTLLSPSRGRIDAMIRNCRKPKSHNLNAAELFALGDYMLHETGGHIMVTSVHLIETFYPLRSDYTRLTCGTWLLSLAEAVAEPEQEQQELFMLLLHTLSRLAFSDQPWKPLLSGFLLHFSACQGFKPRLNHCCLCGKPLAEEPPTTADVTMITGRINLMARQAMISPNRVLRKNWMSPVKGRRLAAAIKARKKHRMKIPAT